MTLHIPTLIEQKREGAELSPAGIRALVDGYTSGSIPDYQMSAFAMAVYFKGMTAAETAALTRAMIDSGASFDHGTDHPPVVDKHSTGGIGDKVSLILAPLLACDDLWIPMVSGRGLGITGGTLDKLESIPRFNISLSLAEANAQLCEIGVCMMGQTADFCPADKKLYSLRDVTGTVPSIPLITASIMSKKLAESLDRLVLDVKYGSGAFMQTREQAVELAESMTAVGAEMGVQVTAQLNPMDEPLGHAVGNALEVIECLDVLNGGGPNDLIDTTLSLAAEVSSAPLDQLRTWLQDGSARRKFDALVTAQGGDPSDLARLAEIHRAPVIVEVPALASGTLTQLDAQKIGQASVQLGAGRATADADVDHRVGFDHIVKCGTRIQEGDPLLRIHALSEADADAAAQHILTGVTIS